jgi:hypothetical protein
LVGAGFNERLKRTSPAQEFLYFRGRRGGSGSGSGGTFEWVDSGNGALPKMVAWMGFGMGLCTASITTGENSGMLPGPSRGRR